MRLFLIGVKSSSYMNLVKKGGFWELSIEIQFTQKQKSVLKIEATPKNLRDELSNAQTEL